MKPCNHNIVITGWSYKVYNDGSLASKEATEAICNRCGSIMKFECYYDEEANRTLRRCVKQK